MHLYESTPLKTIKVEKRFTLKQNISDSAASLFVGDRELFDMDLFLCRKKRKGGRALNY